MGSDELFERFLCARRLLIDEPTSNRFVDFEAITIMFSSPKRENYKDFLKLHFSTARYMPVWSYDEIEQCRSLLFEATVTAAKARELFVRWGGVPRYVLEKAHDQDAQQSLGRALSLAKVSVLQDAAGSLDLADTHSHKLMRINVDDDYEQADTTFASDFIADRVISGASTERLKEMTAFLAGSQDVGVLGALRGHLFEAFAHDAILRGGDFEVRSLGNSAVGRSTVTFSQSTKRWFRTSSELKDFGELDYCRPISKNFGVIDAIRMPCSLLQMTVAPKHDIDERLLGVLLDSLAEASEYVLYFVVPDYMFDNFKASVPLKSGRFDRLAIKALKIPLSGESRPGRVSPRTSSLSSHVAWGGLTGPGGVCGAEAAGESPRRSFLRPIRALARSARRSQHSWPRVLRGNSQNLQRADGVQTPMRSGLPSVARPPRVPPLLRGPRALVA